MWVKLNGRDNNACMQPSEKLLKKWLRVFVKDSRPLKALDNAPSSDVKLLTTLRNFSISRKIQWLKKIRPLFIWLLKTDNIIWS